MNFEISGKLIVTESIVDVTVSFRKREFVIEVVNERNSDWNDFIKFQLTQDKCLLLDSFNIGDFIKVTFNIRGRKWEKDGNISYFSNLEAWKLEKSSLNATTYPSSISSSPPSPPPLTKDDIPFEKEREDVADF